MLYSQKTTVMMNKTLVTVSFQLHISTTEFIRAAAHILHGAGDFDDFDATFDRLLRHVRVHGRRMAVGNLVLVVAFA